MCGDSFDPRRRGRCATPRPPRAGPDVLVTPDLEGPHSLRANHIGHRQNGR